MQFSDRLPTDILTLSNYFAPHQLMCALNDSKIGMVVCDRRFRYKALNQSVAEIHNVPIKGHMGHSFHHVLGNFADKILPLWESVFISGRPSINLEVIGKLPKRSDTGRWIENLFPLQNGRGKVTEVGCIVIETTPPGSAVSPVSYSERKSSAIHGARPAIPDQSPSIPLAHRELDVLRLLAHGKTNKEISAELAISVRTVETYRARLMLKLQATSVAHLVQYAIRNRIIPL